jgi:hypothetical protein
MISRLMLCGSIMATPFLTSFVLLGKSKAKLPATPESPTISFHWSSDGKAPSLSEKEKFRDGSYENYSDAELTPIIIQEAMDQWNAVRGSYLKLELETQSGELEINKEDKINNIVVKHANNASMAAYAAPQIEDGSTEISDCDIVINDHKVSVASFLETVTHELGHCVGLGHPHTHYGAIMSYSRSGKSHRLSADDKAGVIYLYPDPAYGSGDEKNLIACGSIHAAAHGKGQGPWLLLALALPVVMSHVSWLRQRSPLL